MKPYIDRDIDIDDFLRLVGPIYAELLRDRMVMYRQHGARWEPLPEELTDEAVQQAIALYDAAVTFVHTRNTGG